MAERIVLQGGSVVHPTVVAVEDVLIDDGVIVEVGASLDAPAGALVLDASGCLIGPGLVDLHAHLREPGGEEAETVETGALAGALGGYSAVVAMPNTVPAIDSASVVAQVLALGQQAVIDVAVAGSITVGRKGAQLSPMAEMAALGVRIFTDDGTGVQDPGLMRRAMEYARGIGVTLAEHCEDESLAAGGSMNESALSATLGLGGRPALAEELMVARDIALAELTGCTLHLLHLSTARSVELVAEARARGVQVSAEVAPHHLTLTEALCAGYDPIFKVHPPLRQDKDLLALRAGLADRTIDAVATDHAPHPPQAKDLPFDEAAPGMLGLQTALALTYEALGGPDADPLVLFDAVSRAPARIAGLRASDQRIGGHLAHGGAITAGDDANLCVFDPTTRVEVRVDDMVSRASNTPYAGRVLTGQVRHTIVGGRAVVRDGGLA